MPRSGYTSVTVPVQLRDRLKITSSELGFSSVPQMLDSWLWERTGTVQVRDGLGNQARARFGSVCGIAPNYEKRSLVRPPGFEPGSSAWQAEILPGWTTAANIPDIQSSEILICYPASLKHEIHRSTAENDEKAMVIVSP